MEYALIIILQVIGVAFNANRKIVELDKKYPGIPFSEIKAKFIANERITFIGSGLILLLQIICHVIVDLYYPKFREVEIPLFVADWSVPYIIASFIVALICGYYGQWLMYRIFNKGEKYLEDKTK